MNSFNLCCAVFVAFIGSAAPAFADGPFPWSMFGDENNFSLTHDLSSSKTFVVCYNEGNKPRVAVTADSETTSLVNSGDCLVIDGQRVRLEFIGESVNATDFAQGTFSVMPD